MKQFNKQKADHNFAREVVRKVCGGKGKEEL